MANITSQNEVTVSGLARVVEGIKSWVENSAAAHSAYRVHDAEEWASILEDPEKAPYLGNYVFDAQYVDGEIQKIYSEINSANSATSADMEVIAAALNDLDDRINATSGKADKVAGATSGNFAGLDENGNLIDLGKNPSDFKTKQTAVNLNGSTIKTITALTQNDNGEVSATFQDIQTATTSVKGVVQLKNSIDTSESDTTKAVTPKAVKDAIDAAVSTVYRPAGTKTVSQLTSSLLDRSNVGNVYNITDSGETTSDFVEGAGKPINAGDSVGVCDIDGTLKFDLLASFVDLSGYKTKQTAITSAASNALQTVQQIQQDTNGELTITYQKIQSATTGQEGVVLLAGSIGAEVASENNKAATEKAVRDAINALDVTAVTVGASKTISSISESDGKISATAVDIQIAESQVTNLTTDLGKKADKVTGATSGNLAMLDENGNLKDSGSKAADFATAAQGTKAESAIQGVKLAGSALTPDANKVVDIPLATSAANGLMSSTDKGKLDAIQAGAEVNQNAFSNVKVGSTTVAAVSKTDTLEIVTSGNVTVSANASNDTILIGIPLMDETDVNNILNLLN